MENSGPLIDGGSNICVTGDPQLLLDSVDIPPIAISVALDGTPSSLNDTITKRGLLPLTLSDGTTYYQPCFYCANLVETIISPAAILASSDQLYYWTQVGCIIPGNRFRKWARLPIITSYFKNYVQITCIYVGTKYK